MGEIKLFCFPFAGGSAALYSAWAKHLHPIIKLIPVELSGRGRRFAEPFTPTFNDMLADIWKIVRNELNDAPYAFFGHSMGSVLGFELARTLKEQHYPDPLHLFLSGSDAPEIRDTTKKTHLLPNDKFLEEVKRIEGTPDLFFEHQELIDLYLPVLKNDFAVIEQYVYEEKPHKLDCDMSILYGNAENFEGDLTRWRKHTNKTCGFQEFAGGHFFLQTHQEKVINFVNYTIMRAAQHRLTSRKYPG